MRSYEEIISQLKESEKKINQLKARRGFEADYSDEKTIKNLKIQIKTLNWVLGLK